MRVAAGGVNLPFTSKQMAFFRIAMHDMKRSKKERDNYRRMYTEGKGMAKKPPVKRKK